MSGINDANSILNLRGYTRSSGSGAKGGVQYGALNKSGIILANRHKISAGGTYTSLSNSINGMQAPMYFNPSTCAGTTNNMGTLGKIAMFTALAATGFALGSLVSKGIENLRDNGGTGGADLASTMRTISGDNFIADMDNAQGSKELKDAIDKAIEYLNGDLSTALNNAHAKAITATQNLEQAKANIETAKNNEQTAKNELANQKQSVLGLESALNLQKSNLAQSKADLAKVDENYAKALTNTQAKETALATAQTSFDNANRNYENIKKAYDAETDETKKAELKKQLDAAETTKNTAESTLNTKKTELTQAQTDEKQALQAVNTTKAEVKTAKEKLNQVQQDYNNANTRYETAKQTLKEKENAYQQAQQAHKEAITQKEQYENDIEAYEKLANEKEALRKEIQQQQGRCQKMWTKEQKKISKFGAKSEELQTKAGGETEFAGLSNDTESPTLGQRGKLARAERAEAKEDKWRSRTLDTAPTWDPGATSFNPTKTQQINSKLAFMVGQAGTSADKTYTENIEGQQITYRNNFFYVAGDNEPKNLTEITKYLTS